MSYSFGGSWERAYDVWKTSPPEEEDSKFKCDCCGDNLWVDDKYMEINGEVYCHYCAEDWFENQWQKAKWEQCYGDE